MFHDMGFGMMGFGWIFWLVLIVGVVYLVLNNKSRHKSIGEMNNIDTPLDILKKRYANEEINKDEFERIKNDLLK